MPVYVPPLGARDRAALLLATGRLPAEVAAEVGVNPRTIRRWRSTDEAFRASIDRVRLRLLDRAADALTSVQP